MTKLQEAIKALRERVAKLDEEYFEVQSMLGTILEIDTLIDAVEAAAENLKGGPTT